MSNLDYLKVPYKLHSIFSKIFKNFQVLSSRSSGYNSILLSLIKIIEKYPQMQEIFIVKNLFLVSKNVKILDKWIHFKILNFFSIGGCRPPHPVWAASSH